MALSLNKARVSPIAIDFGADTVKLLQVTPGKPAHLTAAAAAPLLAAARQDPAARASALGSTLKALLKQAPFKGRRVICSIPAFQTLIQHLELPGGDAAKLDEQVHDQLRQRLHVEPRNMVVRHFRVGDEKQAPGRRDVVCVAASKQGVMQYIDLCRQCKLEVVGMHAEPLALLEAIRGENADDPSVRAVIDIGAATTKLLVVDRGRLAFAKSIHAGGDQVTRQLAADQGLEFDEARRLRVGRTEDAAVAQAEKSQATASLSAAGLATLRPVEEAEDDLGDGPLPATGTAATAVPTTGNAAASSSEMVECLIDELRLSLRYYHDRCPDRPVDKLVFVGGEANDTRACMKIARSLHVAAQLGDPLGNVLHVGNNHAAGVNLDHPQPAWAVARGLTFCEANV